MIQHLAGIMTSPGRTWQRLSSSAGEAGHLVVLLLMAALPAIAWYYGTTQVGWTVGEGEVIRLTQSSATRLIALFYLAMVTSVCIIGWFIHWMAENYGAQSSPMRGITIATYTAMPLFLAGLIGFFPALGFALVVAIVAISWSLSLLYTGIPAVMGVPQERGFLFASAVVAVCLVILIGIMTASVILWDMGFAPEYTN